VIQKRNSAWPASGGNASRIYDAVKARLLDGELRSGESISTEDLAAEFGVSKQPTMEALRVLATEGFIDIIPQVGVRVKVCSDVEFADFFQVFAAAEGVAASLAAARHTQEELIELQQLSQRIEANCQEWRTARERTRGYRILNRSFHQLIHNMAHSQVIESLAGTFWDKSDFYINAALPDGALSHRELTERLEEHRRIVGAIAASDEEAVRAIVEGHITRNIALRGLTQSHQRLHS
jgi:DNA-binding GntR family transcriptional regulator